MAKDGDNNRDELEQELAGKRRGLFAEIWAWLGASGKWWLIPILLGLILVGVLVTLGGTVFAPFIYPLF